MTQRWLAAAAAVLLLAGCAGQTRPPSSPDGAPSAAEINVQLGVAYLQRGQYELALTKINKALAANPRLAGAHAAMALLRERLGETDVAGTHYRRALALAPDDPTIQHNYGVFLCKQEDYEGAQRYLLKAAANPLYGTPAMAYTNAAVCARSGGDDAAAARYLTKALAKDPLYGQALYEAATLQLTRGKPQRARAYLERYWRVAGQSPESLHLAVQVAEALGESNRAREYRLLLRQRLRDAEVERDMGVGSHE